MSPEEIKQGLITVESNQLVFQMDQRLDLMSRLMDEIALTSINDEVSHPERITLDVARQFLDDSNSVDLSKYQLIDDEAAIILSENCNELFLDGLITLSEAAANSLACIDGNLSFASLKHLDDGVAHAFGRHQGELCLDGISSLSDKAAELLSAHNGVKGGISLDSLKNISKEGAEFLVNSEGSLSMPNSNYHPIIRLCSY
jgi:hypothetical protein